MPIIKPRNYLKPAQRVIDRQHPLSQGLVGYWPMGDVASGTTLDIAGGNNGTISSALAMSGSHHGGLGLAFDGVGYVTATSVPVSASVSVFGWIYATSLANAYTSLFERYTSGNDVWQLLIKSSGQLAIYMNANGSVGSIVDPCPTVLAVNRWYHVGFTWDQVTVRAYINGVLEASNSSGGTSAVGNTGTVTLGRDPNNAGRVFTGSMEGVCVYNRTLSPADIAQLYKTPYAFLRAPRQNLYFLPTIVSGGGSVTGSAAWTEAADTWAGAGAVAIAGTAAWTETKDGWSATGGIVGTGTAAWTEASDTWSATGTVTTGPSGAVAWTEAADSWAAAGGVAISGTVSWTETKDTWAVSGSITLPGVSGSASWTEGPDVWAGLGSNGVLWTPVTPASGTWTPATLNTTTWVPQ